MLAHRPESMRRHNERLVLTLLRQRGPMPRSLLAQATGLSAQAMSNIVRDLMARGLIAAERKLRGRVGQPLEPLALAPRGAFFAGLKVGRRSAQMVLTDFTGTLLAAEEARYPGDVPEPDSVVSFAAAAIAALTGPAGPLTEAERERLAGIGIAMPFRLWDWGAGFAPWQGRDLAAEIGAATGLPALLENDASCACAAEMIFGPRDLPQDFLHVYIGHFAGGGLVLGGQLWLGPRGNAAAIGSSPVPGAGAGAVQLIDRASLSGLEAALGARLPAVQDGTTTEADDWPIPPALRSQWLAEAAPAIAFVALSAATLLDLEAVVIDGAFPPTMRADLVAAVHDALTRLPGAGINLPQIRAGSLGRLARAIGAAALPMADAYMLDVIHASPATGAG